MTNIRIPLEVSLDDLAEQFTSIDRKHVMAFLVSIDEAMADCEFTEKLRDHLTVALENEGVPAPTAKYADFVQWLVRMDDPTDVQGCTDRQVVTLTQIIGRARALLDGA